MLTRRCELLYGEIMAAQQTKDQTVSLPDVPSITPSPFAASAAAPTWVIAVALVLIIIATATLNLVVFARDILTPARETTAGFVTPTLIANVGMFLLFVHLFIRYVGRLTYSDIGLQRQHILPALVVTALIWLTIQVVGLVWSIATTGAVYLDTIWQQVPATYVIGRLIGQVAGNALFEETVYRGFLMPQAFHKLQRALHNNLRRRIVAAIVISQLVFALIHIPGRILQGMGPASMGLSLSLVFVLGLLFAIMYVRTGNLYVCIGTHALINAPTSLFASQSIGVLTAITMAVIMILVGPRLLRLTTTIRPPKEVTSPGITLET